ncbi:MAG: hypothetical protein V4489_04450, partial [Chlamydiota bacterium]
DTLLPIIRNPKATMISTKLKNDFYDSLPLHMAGDIAKACGGSEIHYQPYFIEDEYVCTLKQSSLVLECFEDMEPEYIHTSSVRVWLVDVEPKKLETLISKGGLKITHMGKEFYRIDEWKSLKAPPFIAPENDIETSREAKQRCKEIRLTRHVFKEYVNAKPISIKTLRSRELKR